MEKKEYLVLGATGKTGRRVVDQLKKRGEVVRAAAPSLEVKFDWNDPQTWEPALSGAYGVYLVVPVDENSVETTERFVAAMEKTGVSRVALLSARGVGG